MKPTFVATCCSPLMMTAWHPWPIVVYSHPAMRKETEAVNQYMIMCIRPSFFFCFCFFLHPQWWAWNRHLCVSVCTRVHSCPLVYSVQSECSSQHREERSGWSASDDKKHPGLTPQCLCDSRSWRGRGVNRGKAGARAAVSMQPPNCITSLVVQKNNSDTFCVPDQIQLNLP